jgi:hypothetical protein
MTEADWHTSTDADLMLRFLKRRKNRPSERKFRLYAVACCRRLWPVMEEPCRQAIVVAEQYADGQANDEALAAASQVVVGRQRRRGVVDARIAWEASEGATRPRSAIPVKSVFSARLLSGTNPELLTDDESLAALVREIVGNPFRPVAIKGAWLTGSVTGLAQAIYDERGFERLPILADALVDAGCDNADMLDHCRAPGPHVRGCWVVDLLTGRA